MNDHTLIWGDVGTGKTRYTGKILAAFIAAGFAPQTAVLDLAPAAVGQIGGKMVLAADSPVLYLTDAIVAPRLTAQTNREAEALARQNARLIEKLFDRFYTSGRPILFINDASLYLQAGSFPKLAQLLEVPDTAVVNAYYGSTFAPSPLTRREKAATERLQTVCGKLIHLSKKD
jgi:hypothetical protein